MNHKKGNRLGKEGKDSEREVFKTFEELCWR
jgi:hypothetical protein